MFRFRYSGLVVESRVNLWSCFCFRGEIFLVFLVGGWEGGEMIVDESEFDNVVVLVVVLSD